MGSEQEKLITKYPRLYHMAHRDSFDNIKKHGLLSTQALLELYGYEGKEKEKILSERREETKTITCEGLPEDAYIRDQKPMTCKEVAAGLRKGGSKLTPSDWYRLLNSKVFFWPDKCRLYRMAKAYKSNKHAVLVLNTELLVAAYSDTITLCHMNSGNSRRSPPKNENIFCSIENYDWRKRRYRIAELCVEGRVDNITDYLIDAFVIKGKEEIRKIDFS